MGPLGDPSNSSDLGEFLRGLGGLGPHGPSGPGPAPASDVAALESRLEHVERKLDRLIELVGGGAKPPPATSDREDAKSRPPHEEQQRGSKNRPD